MEASNNITFNDYQELAPFKINDGKKVQTLVKDSILTPRDATHNVLGFNKENIDLPSYFFVAPFLNYNKEKSERIIGIYLYDYLVGEYATIEKGSFYDWASFLSKASSDNPLFQRFFPALHVYLKNKNTPWSSEHIKELESLLKASLKLNFQMITMDALIEQPFEKILGLFDYLMKYGPLINGYTLGRDELFNEFEKPIIHFKIRNTANESFLYYYINNNPLNYCLTPIKNLTGHFICINTKDSLESINSFIDQNLIIKAKWEIEPKPIMEDEFNAFFASYFLFNINKSQNNITHYLPLKKYYQHLASVSYDNGEAQFINFIKEVLSGNLKYLNHVYSKLNIQANDRHINEEISNILPKLVPKQKSQEDPHCFLKNLEACTRSEAILKHQSRSGNIKLFFEKYLRLMGMKNNLCHLAVHFTSVKSDYDEETKSRLKEAGKEDKDIFESVSADSKEYLEKHDKIYSCLMNTDVITDMFNKWRSNTHTPNDVKDCMLINEIDDRYE